MVVRREGRRQRPTKYKECNVLLLAARYTFHRISPGDVPWNNKDKNAREKDWDGQRLASWSVSRAVYVEESANLGHLWGRNWNGQKRNCGLSSFERSTWIISRDNEGRVYFLVGRIGARNLCRRI